MEIIKKTSNNYDGIGREIIFKEDDKIFILSFASNLDLYFSFFSKNDQSFEIKKDNIYIYVCFLK